MTAPSGARCRVRWTCVTTSIMASSRVLYLDFVAGWIALFEGYDATPTAEGVSRATTRTVVHTALAVLGLDFVLTALMFGE